MFRAAKGTIYAACVSGVAVWLAACCFAHVVTSAAAARLPRDGGVPPSYERPPPHQKLSRRSEGTWDLEGCIQFGVGVFFMLAADQRTRTIEEWQRVVEQWCKGEGRYHVDSFPTYVNRNPGPEFPDGGRSPMMWSVARPLELGAEAGAAVRAAVRDAAYGAWDRAQTVREELPAAVAYWFRHAAPSAAGVHGTAEAPAAGFFGLPRNMRVPVGRRG